MHRRRPLRRDVGMTLRAGGDERVLERRELFGAGHWDTQSHRNVVGNVIPADCENAALFHRAIDIKNVISRAATDIDHERAEIFLMLRQDHLR